MEHLIRADVVVAAPRAEGEALVSPEPLSFWGGYDSRTGEIIDRRHPLSGVIAAGRVLVLPGSRGSSTTTAVILDAIRTGTAPAALMTTARDELFALAAIVADEMYGRTIPVLVIQPGEAAAIRTGDHLVIERDGTIRWGG
jgi:predicted aconitase with swiveling domain